MADKKFTFYNVENGQAVLVSLDNDRHVMFDIKQRTEDADESDKTVDVQASLLMTLPKLKESKRRHLSVFCLSHSHLDHCQGIERVFRLPALKDQEDSDDLIQIDELWVTAGIFNSDVKGVSEKVQKEAKRRLKLFKDGKDAEANQSGNMLGVFGKNNDYADLKYLPALRNPSAGTLFNKLCGETQTDWELFVHCPFSYLLKENDEEKRDENNTSLIVQFTMKEGDAPAKLLIGGDAGCAVWRRVNKTTKTNKNTERLLWNIFFAPHHGSYKFFTEKEHEEGRAEAKNNPDKDSMEILGRGEGTDWIVCSSRPVKEKNYEDKDPPHIEAIEHYRDKVDDDKFVCLMEYPIKDEPDPLVLRLTDRGLQKKSYEAAAIAVGGKTTGKAQQWGSR
jgi:hypothetical protein